MSAVNKIKLLSIFVQLVSCRRLGGRIRTLIVHAKGARRQDQHNRIVEIKTTALSVSRRVVLACAHTIQEMRNSPYGRGRCCE